MTKWIVLYCFLFTINIIHAQNITSDSSLQNTSKNLLQKEFSFVCKKGKLESVLNQLSEEQKIKFFYSHDKIQNVNINEKVYPSISLESLLNNLLVNTGFNFMVVGRVIVIVEDDKNINNKDTINSIQDYSSVDSSSSIVIKSSSDSSFSNTFSSKLNDSSKINRAIDPNHIYSSQINLSKLPLAEKRKILKLYDKELKWSNRYHFYVGKNLRIQKDTVENSKSTYIPFVKEGIQKRYFISGSLGYINYNLRIKGNKEFSWNEDLNFNKKVYNSIHPGIAFGFISRNFLLGTGLGFQQFKIKEDGTSIYKKSNGIGIGKGNLPDTFNYSYFDKYSIISIPLEVLFLKQGKKMFAAIGANMEVDLINAKVEKDEFKDYYLNKVEGGSYIYKNHKMAFSSALKAKAGVWVKNNIAISADVQYNYYLTSLSKNSVFSLYPNNYSFQFSIYYLFDNFRLKN